MRANSSRDRFRGSVSSAWKRNCTELPHAFGCEDWLTLRVTTCAELDEAMQAIYQA